MRTHVKNYVFIVVILALGWMLSHQYGTALMSGVLQTTSDPELLLVFFDIVMIFMLGFAVSEFARPTVIPSFVLAIFFGMAFHDELLPIVQHQDVLSVLTTIGAMLILFGGGLDTPFAQFKALIGPILSIALVGTLIQALLTALAVPLLGAATNTPFPVAAAVLLSAALASTDPAAIIPSLKSLHFLNPRVKHIAVSESAINDVVGVVLTTVFLTVLSAGSPPDSSLHAYGLLLQAKNAVLTLRTLGIGAAAGIAGFGVLSLWNNIKRKKTDEGEADAAFFLAVPFAIFTAASVFGGSGFLAVFLCGLLFEIETHFRHVEHYFTHTIEAFMKPMIFMLLGAIVEPADLVRFAGIGLLTGIVFLLIRPVVVFLTLAPFRHANHPLQWNELGFLSFVRETGVIPAVLLVSIRVLGLPNSDMIVAVGLWVILLTLIIQPPLTPAVAKMLGIARDPGAPSKSKTHRS